MKIEITNELKLSLAEINQIQLHSILNVINVIQGITFIMSGFEDDVPFFVQTRAAVTNIISSFKDKSSFIEQLSHLNDFEKIVFSDVEEFKNSDYAKNINSAEINYYSQMLKDVFDVAKIRINELFKRFTYNDDWVSFDANQLISDLQTVFKVIARHSHGKYGIVFDENIKTEQDYLLLLDFNSEIENPLFPDVFKDIMRDLIANARKYSPIGSRIKCSFYITKEDLKLCVKDEGRGIPQNEIQKIIKFGFQGSNSSDVKSYGNGFGLTKAYYFCKEYNGKMWIDSELGKGTTIEIIVPNKKN